MGFRKKSHAALAGFLSLCLAAASYAQHGGHTPQAAPSHATDEKSAQHTPAPAHRHAAEGEKERVPDFITDARQLNHLPPILSEEELLSKAPDGYKQDPEAQEVVAAYRAAREIPRTLAQLPCYCYCDRRVGHKSLHNCFTTKHAAFCKKCSYEALLAYELQKEGMSVEQIRERIIKRKGNETPQSILQKRAKAQPAASAGQSDD